MTSESRQAPGEPPAHAEAPDDALWFSDTVGAIYDCILAPDKWADVLRRIAEHFDLENALLGVAQLGPNAHQLMVQHGIDADWLARADSYADDMIDFWGGRSRVEAFPLEEPILSTEVMPPELYTRNRYYREILAPRGLGEGIIVRLVRDRTISGYMGMSRKMAKGPIDGSQRQTMRLLAPHIRRAVTISDFFNLKVVEHETFRSVLMAMHHAVLLVDETGRVSETNPAADALLQTTQDVEIQGGHLKLANALAQRDLDAALRIAAADDMSKLERRGIGVRVSGETHTPLMLHLMPIGRTSPRQGLTHQAVAAVFIVSPSHSVSPPLDAVALLYNLTPAETQIFASIAEGRTLDETAYALGIGRGTAKTHLLRIFSKTGCNRQAELVALAYKLAAPV